MANIVVKDATGTTISLKAAGAGSDGDPSIPDHSVSSVAPGTAASSLGKAEDAAHTSGDVGVMLLGVRNDSDTAFSGTNADYTPLGVTSAGRVLVQPGQDRVVVTVTPTLDTSAYGAGDVLFDTTTCGSVARVNGGVVILESVTILDEDDQTAAAATLFFLDSNVTLGTANAAPSISDANARKLLGWVPIASGDWLDVGGAKLATVRNIGLTLAADAAAQAIYIAATTAGTPTQTASGWKVKLAFKQS